MVDYTFANDAFAHSRLFIKDELREYNK